MRTKTSGAADSIEATRQKLAAMPGVTGNGQIQDLWREYFLSLGIKGNLRDQMNVFLSGKAQSQFRGDLPVLMNNFAYGHTSPGFTHVRNSDVNGWSLRRTDDYVLKTFEGTKDWTNSLLWNRDLSNAVWSGSATIAQDAVGLDGVANTAWTVTDSDAGTHQRPSQSVTVPNDSTPSVVSIYIGKDQDQTRFPMMRIVLSGGTQIQSDFWLNTETGATDIGGDAVSGDIAVEDEGDFWRLSGKVTNNGTGNTSLGVFLYPARGTTIGSSNTSATGSIVYDFGGIFLNETEAGPRIETEGSPVSKTVAAEPAFVIDPATGKALGYRALQGFTNSLLYSEDFTNGAWVKRGAVAVTGNQEIAPDGSQTMDLVENLDARGFDDLYQLVSGFSANADIQFGVWIKRVSTSGTLKIGNAQSTSLGEWSVDISMLSDPLERVTKDHPAVTENTPFTASGSGGAGVQFWSGSGPIDLYVWGAQETEGALLGPYIETEGTTVSTAADDATEPLPASCQDGFVWVVHARTPPAKGSAAQHLASISDGTFNEHMGIWRTSETNLRVSVRSNGSELGGAQDFTIAGNDSDIKVAVSVTETESRVSVNGGGVNQKSTGSFPTVNTKRIGDVGSTGQPWNSTIAYEALHDDPENWTDADLQAATS